MFIFLQYCQLSSIIMKISLSVLILIFQLLSLNFSQSIQLYAHRWCHKSKLAFDILTKLESTSQQSLNFIYSIQNNQTQTNNITYPTVLIHCKEKSTIYQNQLTLLQVKYWVEILCNWTVPTCAKWMESDHTYQINYQQPSSMLLKWIEDHPGIKVCHNEKIKKENDTTIISIIQKMEHFPYFQSFTHNLRHQIMKNNKTVIGYFYRKKSDGLKMFQSHYQRLKDNDKKLGYQLSPSIKDNLIFLSDSLQNKIIKKLLHFLRISVPSTSIIVYFRFQEGQLVGEPYGNSEIDNIFTYWIHQVTKYKHKAQQPSCLSNFVIHYYQINSLTSIKENIQLLEWKKEGKKQIKLDSQPVLWVNQENKFQICLEGQNKIAVSTLSETLEKLRQIQ